MEPQDAGGDDGRAVGAEGGACLDAGLDAGTTARVGTGQRKHVRPQHRVSHRGEPARVGS